MQLRLYVVSEPWLLATLYQGTATPVEAVEEPRRRRGFFLLVASQGCPGNVNSTTTDDSVHSVSERMDQVDSDLKRLSVPDGRCAKHASDCVEMDPARKRIVKGEYGYRWVTSQHARRARWEMRYTDY